MKLLQNLAAAGAAVVVYKVVDYGLRKFERGVLNHDVPLHDDLPNVEKDAIVVVGSRLDHIPSVPARDAIGRALNMAGSVLLSTVVLQVRDRLMEGVTDDEDVRFVRYLLFSAATFLTVDLLMKPALGMSEGEGRGRRFASHMASHGARRGVRLLMA